MKVLSVSHMFPNRINPHIGVFVKERLRHLALRCELTVVAPVPSFPFSDRTRKYAGLGDLEEIETLDGLTVHHPRYFMIPKYLKILDAAFYGNSLAPYIEKWAEEGAPDLLDFHWVYPDAIGGLSWARKLGKKTVVTVRGNEAIYYFDRCAMRRVVQKRLADFDQVIAVSNDLKTKILAEYGVDPARISVIPNGIDTEKFHLLDRDECRRACGVEQAKRYLLSVSRLSPEKGLEHLLRALPAMHNNEAELVVIGDGPLREELLFLAAGLGIAERVHFLGLVEHASLSRWYNAADLFCLPSLWEGCPNVVIEALACGTPIIATGVGGIPDLVPGADCGTLVAPADAGALAAALDRGLETDWNRRSIAGFGSANSWGDVADRVMKVFERVL